jgi:hypothetical protein
MEFLQSLDLNGAIMALGAALGAGLVLLLKLLFATLTRLTGKTATPLDDKMVEQTKKSFKDKAKDL